MNYLDHAATSPIHPQVQATVMEAMQSYANPSALYAGGREEKNKMNKVRRKILSALGGQMGDRLIFTGSGSEGNNQVMASIAAHYTSGHIITSQIEHPSVYQAVLQLQAKGFEVTFLPVKEDGIIDLDLLKASLREDTRLVSVMTVNNELGTRQPIQALGDLLKDHPAYFHTDAVQAFGQERIDVSAWGIDYLTASGHKINAPKGVGLLYAAKDAPLSPLIYGGGQEGGLRAGTENLPYILGLGKAFELALEAMPQQQKVYQDLTAYLYQGLTDRGIVYQVNGTPNPANPHILNLYFPGIKASQILIACDLKDIALSAGSACSAGSLEPSRILTALYGQEATRLHESVRLSFGWGSSQEDIDAFLDVLLTLSRRIQARVH